MKLLREIQVAMTPRWWIRSKRDCQTSPLFGGQKSLRIRRTRCPSTFFAIPFEPELAQLEHFLDPDSVFLDIGANTGVYTMKAAQHVGRNGIVIAVEPFPGKRWRCSIKTCVGSTALATCGSGGSALAAEETGAGMLWLHHADKPNSFGWPAQSGRQSARDLRAHGFARRPVEMGTIGSTRLFEDRRGRVGSRSALKAARKRSGGFAPWSKWK